MADRSEFPPRAPTANPPSAPSPLPPPPAPTVPPAASPAAPTPRHGWLSNLSAEQKLLAELVIGVVSGSILLFVEHDLFVGLTTEAVLGGGLVVLVGTAVIVWNTIVDPLTAMNNPSAGRQSLAEAINEARTDFFRDIIETVKNADEAARRDGSGVVGPMSEETLDEVHTLVVAASTARGLIYRLPDVRSALRRYTFSLAVGMPVLVVVASFSSSLNQSIQTAILAFVATIIFGALLLVLPLGSESPTLGRWDDRVKELRGLPYVELKQKIKKWAAKEIEHD